MKLISKICIVLLLIFLVHHVIQVHLPLDSLRSSVGRCVDTTSNLWDLHWKPIEQFDGSQNTAINDPVSTGSTVPDVEFPFKNIKDEQGNKLNIIAISAPFRETAHELKYESYKAAGLEFCGISSYLDFPNKIDNPYEDRFHEEREHDYTTMVSTWIHCFRDPGYKLQYSGLPLLLLTEADLKNTDHYVPNTSISQRAECLQQLTPESAKRSCEFGKEYDFIYVCLDDNEQCTPGWNWHNRNWDLGKKCLEVMCEKHGLKGVIVGRKNCEFTEKCNGIVKTLPFLPFHEFQKEMQKCRFLFVPNVSDASPRVITEAMCYDMPVLVNYNILGGWHNVIPKVTGEFFTSEYDISIAIDQLLGNFDQYTPRKWYTEHRGLIHSGKVLSDFLKENYPQLNRPDMKYAYI